MFEQWFCVCVFAPITNYQPSNEWTNKSLPLSFVLGNRFCFFFYLGQSSKMAQSKRNTFWLDSSKMIIRVVAVFSHYMDDGHHRCHYPFNFSWSLCPDFWIFVYILQLLFRWCYSFVLTQWSNKTHTQIVTETKKKFQFLEFVFQAIGWLSC